MVMSTALTKIARLKPEIRLAQAISDFQAALSNDQKAEFRNYRDQEIKAPPTHQDVQRFTADLDRRSGGNIAGARCFGPRFTNFLEGVQIYASIGDVLVGGSQNLIACGIWSLVRMSLLVGNPI
jgi:hypothetical protein